MRFTVDIYPDSLGHQVSVYDAETGEWIEDLFRGFNDDEHQNSYQAAREYAGSIYRELSSETVEVVLCRY